MSSNFLILAFLDDCLPYFAGLFALAIVCRTLVAMRPKRIEVKDSPPLLY